MNNYENIYNNNFNFTNNLILRKRKKNKTLSIVLIFSLLLMITIAIFYFVKRDSKGLNIENYSSDVDHKKTDDFSLKNNRRQQYTYFLNFRNKNLFEENVNLTSLNYLSFTEKNFLVEICFERKYLYNQFLKRINVNKSIEFLSINFSTSLLFRLSYSNNIQVVCIMNNFYNKFDSNFNRSKLRQDKNQIKFKTILYFKTSISFYLMIQQNHFINKSKFHPKSKINHKKKVHQLKNKTKQIKSLKYSINFFLKILFFYCYKDDNSFDLEMYFYYSFNKKPKLKELDSNLKIENILNIHDHNNENLCLSKKMNKFGIITQIPDCLEFYNVDKLFFKYLLEEDYNSFEIDIFIYDLKNKNLNLMFLNKIIISRNNFEFAEVVRFKKDFQNSIIYQYKTSDSNSFNLRICNIFNFKNSIKEEIKIRGIFIDWTFIQKNILITENDNQKFCFKKLLSIQ